MKNRDKLIVLFCFASSALFVMLGLIYAGYALADWMFT